MSLYTVDMATDFVKLYRTFFLGSMRDSPPWTRLVFMACLSLADDTGVFVARPDAIAGFAAIPLPDVELALDQLAQPDPNDTSGVEDGRRILPLGSNRWLVVNYRHYYELHRATERKEYLRQAQRRHRAAKCQQVSTNVNKSTLKERKGKKRKEKEKEGAVSVVLALGYTSLERIAIDYDSLRRQKGLGLWKPVTCESKMKEWAAFTEQEIGDALRTTVSQGWQGVFPKRAEVGGEYDRV